MECRILINNSLIIFFFHNYLYIIINQIIIALIKNDINFILVVINLIYECFFIIN
jgi:hypothetical protein